MTNFEEYKQLVVESLYAGNADDTFSEDRILDILDRIWAKLTAQERQDANVFSRRLGKYIDKNGKLAKLTPSDWEYLNKPTVTAF